VRTKVSVTAALVVGATMVATVGVGVIVLREEPSSPPQPSPSPPDSPAPTPPRMAPGPPPSPVSVRPCTVARDGDGPVAEACRRGGHDAAKRFMKTMVDRAKSLPERFTCDTCHENVDDFTLQEDGRTQLAQLLASLGAPADW
jgi:hypothetical protein